MFQDRVETDESLYFVMKSKWDDQRGFQLLKGQQGLVGKRLGGQIRKIPQHDVASGFDSVNNPRNCVVCQFALVVFRNFYPRVHHFACKISRQPVFFEDGNVAPIRIEIVQQYVHCFFDRLVFFVEKDHQNFGNNTLYGRRFGGCTNLAIGRAAISGFQ